MRGTLHKGQYIVSIISRSVLLTMRNVSGKSYRGNQNTYFMFNNVFFFEILSLYEIMQKKNIVGPNRPQMTIPRMPIACWIPKATDSSTHTYTQNM